MPLPGGWIKRTRPSRACARSDPTFRVSDLRQQPFRRPEDLPRYDEGLRKAGLPE